MKNIRILFSLCLAFLLLVSYATAQDDEAFSKTTLWIGGNYVDFSDYTKRIGEYREGVDKFSPEAILSVYSRSGNGIFRLDGQYHDAKNICAQARFTVGDKYKFKAGYKSLIHQEGKDLLTNLSAREYFPSSGTLGGKMLTSEVLDPDAEYFYDRDEILSEFQMLLSRKHNVRLSAAHRTILKNGQEQALGSNHCFSCHVTSQAAPINERQHHVEVGVDAEFGIVDLGYRFGYRLFESDAPAPYNFYDEAKNPVSGASGPEFSSRLVYDDTTLELSAKPRTEKLSHKVRFRANAGEGTFASSLGYSSARNTHTDLKAESFAGAVNYSLPLGSRTRLVTRGTLTMLKADDPWIDLPTYRDDAADLYEADFDFARYSSLDRWDGRISAEVISRVSPRIVLYLLAGYNRIDRDDYPIWDEGTQTDEVIGQVRMRYRKGLRYTSTVKYRFEKISNPFVSARGLFEANGSEILEPEIPTSNWIFYFQREDLRHQDITSLPTDKHIFEWKSTYHPTGRYTLTIGLKGQYDKNGDLDSLDIKHFSLRPNASINYTPDMMWTVAAGYTYLFDKSKIPIAVALFDG